MHNISLIENNNPQNHQRKTKWSLQFPAAISGCLVRLGFATANFWSSPAVPHLTSSTSKFTLTADEVSWIVSLVFFGAIIGFLLHPLFIDRIGRKYTMLLFSIPQIFSWLTIYYASNVYHLYAGRILSGIGYSAAFATEIIYVGEIAEKNIRGFLVIIGKIAYVLGSVIVVLLGAFVSYDNMNLILLLIPLVFVITFIFMPESPYFYIKINQEEDAFQSLAKLRGTRETRELQFEIESIKEGMITINVSKKQLLIMLFRIKRHRKALLITSLATSSVALSGSSVVANYTQTIVSHIDNPLKPEQASVLTNVIVLICSIIISPMPDWFGRRILTMWFGILVGLSSLTTGCFFFYKYHFMGDISTIYWLPLLVFFIYMGSSNSGLLNLSHILTSELFSGEIKSTAVALINIGWALMEFLLKLCFERLVNVFEIYGIFWMFGFFSLITTLSNFVIMPETKGKTLEEIQQLLDETK